MNRDRLFAFGLFGLAVAVAALLVAGNDWQHRLGWFLWPLLVVAPIAYGGARRRGASR